MMKFFEAIRLGATLSRYHRSVRMRSWIRRRANRPPMSGI